MQEKHADVRTVHRLTVWKGGTCMYKKRLLVLLLLVFALIGCKEQKNVSGEPALDSYDRSWKNVYMNGAFIIGSDVVYTGSLTDHRIYYLEKDMNQWRPLCAKPECSHNTEDCNAYLTTAGIYWDEGYIYYYMGDALWRMKPDGSEHEKIKRISLPDGVSSTYLIYRGYIYFQLRETTDGGKSWKQEIKRVPLEGNDTELTDVFGNPGEDQVQYTDLRCWDDRVTAIGIHGEQQSLYMQDLTTGKQRMIAENWPPDKIAGYTIDGDLLRYFDLEEGFCSVGLSTGKREVLRSPVERKEAGSVYYDEDFIYLCNTNPILDKMDLVDEACRGILFYDLDGNEVDFLSMDGLDMWLLYAFSTPERVYLSDYSKMMELNTFYYIDKAEIGTGNMQLKSLDH